MEIKKIMIRVAILVVACVCIFSCLSCRDEELSAPRIDCVWNNSGSQPAEQINCAYQQQTIAIRGAGFTGVNKVNINGMDIDLTDSQIYNTDASIIVSLPKDLPTSTDTQLAYVKVENAAGSAVFEPFYIFSNASTVKPAIKDFSSKVLIPGSTLTIKGANLGGAIEVYLPLAFDQRVLCEFDETQESTDTEVYVVVPEGVNFAQGTVMIVMEKTYQHDGSKYIEKVYSNVTNFSN